MIVQLAHSLNRGFQSLATLGLKSLTIKLFFSLFSLFSSSFFLFFFFLFFFLFFLFFFFFKKEGKPSFLFVIRFFVVVFPRILLFYFCCFDRRIQYFLSFLYLYQHDVTYIFQTINVFLSTFFLSRSIPQPVHIPPFSQQ